MKKFFILILLIFVSGFAHAKDSNLSATPSAPDFPAGKIDAKDLLKHFNPNVKIDPKATSDLIKERLKNMKSLIGNEGGHGGDPYSMEFITIAQILENALEELRPNQLLKYHFTTEVFAKAVASVRVITVAKDDAILRGAEVDAINFPEDNIILVNSDRWRQLSLQNKVQLVLHEYFGILGIERDRFDVSIQFLALTNQVSEAIAHDPKFSNLMVNIFYGQCNALPSLTAAETCEQGSVALTNAEACARGQAEAHCHLAGKTSCQLIETTYKPVISQELVGVRYCQVLTIMK